MFFSFCFLKYRCRRYPWYDRGAIMQPHASSANFLKRRFKFFYLELEFKLSLYINVLPNLRNIFLLWLQKIFKHTKKKGRSEKKCDGIIYRLISLQYLHFYFSISLSLRYIPLPSHALKNDSPPP